MVYRSNVIESRRIFCIRIERSEIFDRNVTIYDLFLNIIVICLDKLNNYLLKFLVVFPCKAGKLPKISVVRAKLDIH